MALINAGDGFRKFERWQHDRWWDAAEWALRQGVPQHHAAKVWRADSAIRDVCNAGVITSYRWANWWRQRWSGEPSSSAVAAVEQPKGI